MGKKIIKKSVGVHSGSQIDLFNQLLVVVIAATLTTFPFIFDSFSVSKIFVLAIGLTYISTKFLSAKNMGVSNKLPIFLSFTSAFFLLSAVFSWWRSDVPLLRGLFGQFGRGNGVIYYFFVIFLFIFAVKTFKSTSAPKMHRLITGLSWFMALYATLQRVGIDIAKLDTRDLSPVVLTFGNSNFAGAMLSVLFAYQFTYAVQKKSFGVYQLSLLLALTVTTSFTAAVQGYLLILFAIFLGASIFFTQRFRSIWALRGVLSVWGLGFIGLLLGVFGKFIFADIFSRSTFQARIEYWKVTLKIIQDYPFFGIGPDKLFDVTANYMSPGSLKIITSTRVDNAHNWFLNLGANYGLITLLSLLMILGYVFYRMVFLFRNLSSSNPIVIAASVGFTAMFIDGLVSLEQPGLGIWMYLLGGVTVAGSLKLDSLDNNLEKTDSKHLIKLFSICSLAALSVSSILIGNRVLFDGVLRSNIQTALLNQGTQQTYINIESTSIRLKSEPEYSVQALKPLAAIGDGKKLDSISKTVYDYYPRSIQATLIRADVLRALNRETEACPLRSRIVANTPWDQMQVENYFLCIKSNFSDPQIESNIIKIAPFAAQVKKIPIKTSSTEIDELITEIRAVAILANVRNFEGQISSASELLDYGNSLLNRLEQLQNNDPSKVTHALLERFRLLLK